MNRCKMCGKAYVYDDSVGYAADLCGPICDGAFHMRESMLTDMPTINKRKCRTCGNVAWHADNRTPYVLCRKCGSQDTRLVK